MDVWTKHLSCWNDARDIASIFCERTICIKTAIFLQVVVNALIKAIPSIANVMLVCLVFWLIFGIVGVNLFGGKFYKCLNNATGEKADPEIIPDRATCENSTGYEWKNSRISFDNVLYAYLALFQVVCTLTYKCMSFMVVPSLIRVLIQANILINLPIRSETINSYVSASRCIP